MSRAGRVQIVLSPSMRIALQYMAKQEDAPIAAIARRVLRAGLDRTIHSAAVQQLIAQHRAEATAAEWAEMQAEAAEELASDTRPSEASAGSDT